MAEITLMFQPRFVPLIEDGRKAQTIRQQRLPYVGRFDPELGDIAQLAEAGTADARTVRPGRLLGLWPVTEVLPVEMNLQTGAVRLAGHSLVGDDREKFAHQDGFTCWADMQQWFQGHYRDLVEFEGWLIGWKFDERIPA